MTSLELDFPTILALCNHWFVHRVQMKFCKMNYSDRTKQPFTCPISCTICLRPSMSPYCYSIKNHETFTFLKFVLFCRGGFRGAGGPGPLPKYYEILPTSKKKKKKKKKIKKKKKKNSDKVLFQLYM